MTLFDKIFGNSAKNDLKKKLKTIQNDVKKTYEPCRKIGIEIIRASNECYKHLKSRMNITDEKQKKFAEIMIFYEFIYFYIHMTMRYASSVMTEEQMQKLREYLGPLLVSTAIDSFFMHWPQERKEKLTNDFYDCLNDAEIEYATAKEIMSKDGPFKENTLCYKLGARVSGWSDNSLNPVSIFEVTMMAVDELIKMKLKYLVTEAANTL